MIQDLAGQWREEAALLRSRAAGVQADVLESCAADLEERCRRYALEALTLEEAAGESGYSYSALQKKLAAGDLENVGRKGSPRVRRGDLPMKGRPASEDDPLDLTEMLLARTA